MVLFPGCKCCGGGGWSGGECQGCTTTFSKVTNNIITQYGKSSGGYLFNSIFAALPSYWPNDAVHPNPLPYNDRLVLTYDGVEYRDWMIYPDWNSVIGYMWLKLLPAQFPWLQSDPSWGDFRYHQSPVSISVNHTGGFEGPPGGDNVPGPGSYCTAAATVYFHNSYDAGAYWYAMENNFKFYATINGEQLSTVQKATPQIVFQPNNSTTPPRTLDSVSFAGVSGDGTDAVMLVPSLIDQSSIEANWGTRTPVPYKVVPTGDWIDNDVLSFSFTEGQWFGTIQPGTPFPPEPGKSHDVVVQWAEMLSISEACRNVNPNPLP